MTDNLPTNTESPKKVQQNRIIFVLNEDDKTAKIVGNDFITGHVYIPRSIKYGTSEYIIISIEDRSFEYTTSIKTITFSEDSEIRIIGKYAFLRSSFGKIVIPRHVTKICEGAFYECSHLYHVTFQNFSELNTIEKSAFNQSSVSNLSLPSSVTNLEEGWCERTERLNFFSIILCQEKNYYSIQNKMIVGKSDFNNNNDLYDNLILIPRSSTSIEIPQSIKQLSSYSFSRSKITSIIIPSGITHIFSGAFEGCSHLETIEFSKNSTLKYIGDFAFSCTKIKEIIIPSHVKYIGKSAFYWCNQLKKIEFEENSEIQTIDQKAFSNSSVKIISLPSCVSNLNDYWCEQTKQLNKIIIIPCEKENISYLDNNDKIIVGKSNPKNDEYDILIFACRDIKEITIPPTIKQIGSSSLSDCNFQSITIPSQVTHIHAGAFENSKVKEINISKDSQLSFIGENAFKLSEIQTIFIPENVTQINKSTFESCFKIDTVEFAENSKLETICENAFSSSWLKKIVIPPSVKKICYCAFWVEQLIDVEIPSNSNLQIIEKCAFKPSGIEHIFIPSHVTFIGESSFSSCRNLRTVEFAENSELKTIEKFAFNDSPVENISLPSNVLNLEKGWCINMEKVANLKIIPCEQKNISLIDDKIIVGKSDINKDIFDIIVIAPRNIVEVTIPPYITKIASSSFEFSNIVQIVIPSNVTHIESLSFASCKNLRSVEFTENSNIHTIEEKAFMKSNIEKISIPSSISNLEEGWCSGTAELKSITIIPCNQKNISLISDKIIVGKSDINKDVFDLLLFARRDIRYVDIPSTITKISKSAFEQSTIERIEIPANVTHICFAAFYNCKNLRCLTIPNNSQLQEIGRDVFKFTQISSIYFPPHVSHFYENDLTYCPNVKIIEFAENTEYELYNHNFYISRCYNKNEILVMFPVKERKERNPKY